MAAPFASSILTGMAANRVPPSGDSASSPPKSSAIPPTFGATAQTSGFVDADQTPSSQSGAPSPHAASSTSGSGFSAPQSFTTSQFGFMAMPTHPMGGFQPVISGGGGLGSSPNVPKPGTSIDPATGKPYTAGLTRAELEAKKAAEASASSSQGFGGLGSSPNVPAPGTSIDPATGKPYSAGLTRAELDALKAKGAGLLDPTPQAEQARRSSTVKSQFGVLASGEAIENTQEGRRLSDLTGREQAAKQLAGTAGTAGPGDITPGLELPGGWGPTKQTALPGTGPNAPTSVYEDIGDGLEKLGTAAFNLIPRGLKEVLNPEALDKGKQPEGQPPKGRRSSVGVLFEQAKHQGEKLLHDAQETIAQGQRRASVTINSDTGALAKVKHFLAEAGAGTAGPVAVKAAALPSEEYTGAKPGDRSGGVGALPGKNTEAGVAILPDEKKPPTSLPSQENQGMRPGETSAGVGALPGKGTESGVAVLPDVKAAEGSAGGSMPNEISGTSTPAVGTSESVQAPTNTAEPTARTHHVASEEPTPAHITGAEHTSHGPSAAVPVHASALAAASGDSDREGVAPTDTAASTATPPAPPHVTPTGAATTHDASNYPTSRDVSATESVPVHTAPTDITPTTAAPAGTSSSDFQISDAPSSGNFNKGNMYGLAPALPSTFLGTGAATGATDVETTGLREVTPVAHHDTSITSTSAHDSTLSPHSVGASDTRHAQDRTTSSASITAIRHGNEGNRPSHLHQSTIAEDAVPEKPVGDATGAATAATAPAAAAAVGEHISAPAGHTSNTKSLTPGNENEGIGHPDSRGEGTTREPGTYPKADHHGQAVDPLKEKLTATTPGTLASEKDKSPVSPTTAVTGAHSTSEAKTSGLGAAGTIPTPSHTEAKSSLTTSSNPVTPASPSTKPNNANGSVSSPKSPTSPIITGHEKGHSRTESGASTGSNGKKKTGFLKKLKEKLK